MPYYLQHVNYNPHLALSNYHIFLHSKKWIEDIENYEELIKKTGGRVGIRKLLKRGGGGGNSC